MLKKKYVCPIHPQRVLFSDDNFDMLVKIETAPSYCPECSKHYLKHECNLVEQSQEEK